MACVSLLADYIWREREKGWKTKADILPEFRPTPLVRWSAMFLGVVLSLFLSSAFNSPLVLRVFGLVSAGINLLLFPPGI